MPQPIYVAAQVVIGAFLTRLRIGGQLERYPLLEPA